MVKKRRRRSAGNMWMWGSIGLVVAIVLAIVLVEVLQSSTPAPKQQTTGFGHASAKVISEITTIPTSVFNKVGIDSPEITVYPTSFKAMTGQAPLTTKVGNTVLPLSFFYGADYCPYCAATRWGMIIALTRFGTFPGWKWNYMFSSATDYAPNTPTFTLTGATYKSKYFAFVPYEVQDRNRKTIQVPPANITQLLNQYDYSDGGYSFPFMDMGNKAFIAGSAFDPLALQGITTQPQIASQLDNPNNPVTQAIIATANYVSAGLCSMAKSPPASVCNSSGVEAAAAQMGIK